MNESKKRSWWRVLLIVAVLGVGVFATTLSGEPAMDTAEVESSVVSTATLPTTTTTTLLAGMVQPGETMVTLDSEDQYSAAELHDSEIAVGDTTELCGNGTCIDLTTAKRLVGQTVKILDGDTIDIRFDDGEEVRVRLTGINAPEKDECGGSASTTALTQLIEAEDGRLYLFEALGGDTVDRWGRTLGYLLGAQSGTFLNYQMILNGNAGAVAYDGHVGATMFSEAEQWARTAEIGKWSAVCNGETSVQVTAINPDAVGNDRDNLTDEWVTFMFIVEDGVTMDIDGWIVADESSSNRYTFGNYQVSNGARIRLITGCGQDTTTGVLGPAAEAVVYWCSANPVWNNRGDTIYVWDETGRTVGSYGW